jgi:hypothetical protein
LDEQPARIANPADAIHHGVGMLHQDPLDFPPMSVIDNFLIGYEKQGLIPTGPKRSPRCWGWQKSLIFTSTPTRTSTACRSASASSLKSCGCCGWARAC